MIFYVSVLLMLLSFSGGLTCNLHENPYLGALLVIGTIFRCIDKTIRIGPWRIPL